MSPPLPPELHQFVQNEITSGRYGSEDDLLCDAVRLLRSWKLHQLREKVQLGVDQISRGEETVIENDEQLAAFFDDIESEVQSELAIEQY